VGKTQFATTAGTKREGKCQDENRGKTSLQGLLKYPWSRGMNSEVAKNLLLEKNRDGRGMQHAKLGKNGAQSNRRREEG